jgi:hypothetical protein
MKATNTMKLKNIQLAALTCAVILGSAAVSQAALIVSEDFSYADGGLSGQNGGTGFGSNVWFQTSTNVTGGVAGGTGNASARRNFAASLGTTGTIWVSFDWGNSAKPTENGSYGGLTFYEGQADFDANQRFLIGNTWPGSGHDVWQLTNATPTTELNYPSMKSAVAKLDLGAGTVSLWLGATGSPVDVSGPAVASASGLALANLQGIRINGQDFGGSVAQSFDNLLIGTTMADVNAVPEPSSLALLLFGGMFMWLFNGRRGK